MAKSMALYKSLPAYLGASRLGSLILAEVGRILPENTGGRARCSNRSAAAARLHC